MAHRNSQMSNTNQRMRCMRGTYAEDCRTTASAQLRPTVATVINCRRASSIGGRRAATRCTQAACSTSTAAGIDATSVSDKRGRAPATILSYLLCKGVSMSQRNRFQSPQRGAEGGGRQHVASYSSSSVKAASSAYGRRPVMTS